jgi:hypothetical protein
MIHSVNINEAFGTYQIAAICSDGIVMGADSLSSIVKPNGEIAAYYGGVQKVFPFKNFAVSSSGAHFIYPYYLYWYYKQFQEIGGNKKVFQENLQAFVDYLGKVHPKIQPIILARNKIIYGGYEGEIPVLCITTQGKYSCVKTKGFISEDDRCDFKYDSKLTCAEAAKQIERSIINYVDQYKKEAEINKHISVLKIAPGNIFSWELNPPQKQAWETWDDFIEAYMHNKIVFGFTSEENKKETIKQMEKAADYIRIKRSLG